MTSSAAKPSLLAVTMGEPAGIGGELTLKAWLRRHKHGPSFVTIDNADRLKYLADLLQLNVPVVSLSNIEEANEIFDQALPVFNVTLKHNAVPGVPDLQNASTVIEAIKMAVAFAGKKIIAGVVTNPIHKNTLYKTGFSFPGHTEYIAALRTTANPPAMMLTCSNAQPSLRVVPVTSHIGLRQALFDLNPALIIQKSFLLHSALINDFGIERPRIAIAGLNPHAGEQGTMGDDEATIIQPAIDKLRSDGIRILGPESPDTMFSSMHRKHYDAAVCMYHDQALIPVKTLDFFGGVNITLGLDIVRTSPDHGTALDIAGIGKADPSSLIAALDMAAGIAATRALRS
ncbi:MAG: 4-hydroxythreonine-4-phosphate dehydrogenase PdxA [Rhodospirillaceae bacterium TMED8]|nr:4-hydroxythreonine-4-phosphate dehydrogenase PdxA [Magnetovibrio sp.]OUT50845.1 MAG: 4-hydroxythreonine-4-phosphate dehydrogenase PdxA [Rhodospirillaceae bacterium TMED8]